MAIKKRLKFECWQCQRPFELLIELNTEPTIMTECPFDGAVCVANLAPYQHNTVVTVIKGGGANVSDAANDGASWDFPPLIPTTPPEDRSSEKD